VRTAAAAVLDFLVEPAERLAEVVPPPPPVVLPVVAVAGLAPGCGATVVARALGAELAARAPGGACAVTAGDARGLGLGLPAAARLARTIAVAGGGVTRAAGRLSLVESADPAAVLAAVAGRAPLVVDVGDPEGSAAAAALADAVVLVGAPSIEPALAVVLAESLGRVGPEPLVVLARARGEADRWEGRFAIRLPESRMGAQAALAGRGRGGAFGSAMAGVADLVEAAA
jgi:hypothetical protein